MKTKENTTTNNDRSDQLKIYNHNTDEGQI